jgi:hypothetical protein
MNLKSHFQNCGVIFNGRFMTWLEFTQVLQAERLGRKLSQGRAVDPLRDVLFGFLFLGACAVAVLGCAYGL